VSPTLGSITSIEGDAVEVDKSLLLVGSIVYDAVFVPGGAASASALSADGDAVHFINEAFRHAKPIGALGEGIELLLVSSIRGVTLAGSGAPDEVVSDKGVVTARSAPDRRTFIDGLVQSIAAHRHWDRDATARVPA
jgi:catalase